MDYVKVLKLPQYFRNLQRLSEIVGVLVKHGFGDLVERIHLNSYVAGGLGRFYQGYQRGERSGLDFGRRLRMVCEELGPTFIKFGQLMATRPDIFPESITREMRELQDSVAPFPSSLARQIVESELKAKLEDIFETFQDEPLAAASIAQVHRARLRDGAEVALKIQRPNIERTIGTDIDILRGIAALVEENMPESRVIGPAKLIEEFSRMLSRECDFRREAMNLKKFAQNFEGEKFLLIPEVFEAYTTRRLLVERYMEGTKLDNPAELERCGVDRKEVAERLSRIVLESIFVHRFFHADPHPGNVFITKTGQIVMLDFGAMGRLDKNRLMHILPFMLAMLNRDMDRVIRILQEHRFAPTELDEIGLKTQIEELVDFYEGQTLGCLELSGLLTEVFEVVRRHGIKPPPDILLVAKSLTTLEYIGACLDPDFDPIESVKPFLWRRYISCYTDPAFYSGYAFELIGSYHRLFSELPRNLTAILRNVARDKFTLVQSIKELPELKDHQNKLLNRFLAGLLGISLTSLGGLLVVLSQARWQATFAYAIFGAGTILLFWVLLAIRKTGGLE